MYTKLKGRATVRWRRRAAARGGVCREAVAKHVKPQSRAAIPQNSAKRCKEAGILSSHAHPGKAAVGAYVHSSMLLSDQHCYCPYYLPRLPCNNTYVLSAKELNSHNEILPRDFGAARTSPYGCFTAFSLVNPRGPFNRPANTACPYDFPTT
ncbi:hypothetical protein BD626DRAFT_119463 [Schizophyllum amplum]|uniref:Uncharacterized protein n=1 Tax=Schizophyllum amplum TaxID=97359 RepID=A0A550CV48_9AGAR|nr:hypothetical protein BD626DRAFT_119463 [Auriculariopsis ampla]